LLERFLELLGRLVPLLERFAALLERFAALLERFAALLERFLELLAGFALLERDGLLRLEAMILLLSIGACYEIALPTSSAFSLVARTSLASFPSCLPASPICFERPFVCGIGMPRTFRRRFSPWRPSTTPPRIPAAAVPTGTARLDALRIACPTAPLTEPLRDDVCRREVAPVDLRGVVPDLREVVPPDRLREDAALEERLRGRVDARRFALELLRRDEFALVRRDVLARLRAVLRVRALV
jgi:hypothetical protein